MPFAPKDWRDDPDHTTPINAASLEDMETRVAGYADTAVAAEASARASAVDAEATARDAADLVTLTKTYGGGRWVTGRWYAIQGASTQSAPSGDGHFIVSPITVPVGQAFDSLAFQITTAGEAGSLIDFVLYNDVDSYPGSAIQIWTAIAGTAGAKQLDLTTPVTATKTRYWCGARFYNSPTTRPTIRSGPSPQFGFSSAGGSNIGLLGAANQGWDLTGFTSTAIPDPFTTGVTTLPGNVGIRVAVRAA